MRAPLKYHKLNAFAKAVHDSVGGKEHYYQLSERVEIDPFSLVGQETKQGKITQADAQVIKEIWDGPHRTNGERLWYFYRPGLIHWRTGLPIFATSFILPFMKARPFAICNIFARWATEEPKADYTKLDIAGFEWLFDATQEVFSSAAADNADLSAFAAHGGKLMIDHGIDDPLIPVEGTIDYHNRMKQIMGEDAVDSFCRVFLGPGDNHGNCHGNGPGITEADGMRALIDWVEHGKVPEALPVVQINQKTGEAIRSAELKAS